MQNLLTDEVDQDFAILEQAYIIEFDLEANGYDPSVGPCCGTTSAEPAFIFDPSIEAAAPESGGIDRDCVAVGPPEPEINDRFSAMAERYCFDDYERKLRRYKQFPGVTYYRADPDDESDQLLSFIGIKKAGRIFGHYR